MTGTILFRRHAAPTTEADRGRHDPGREPDDAVCRPVPGSCSTTAHLLSCSGSKAAKIRREILVLLSIFKLFTAVLWLMLILVNAVLEAVMDL